MIESGKVLIPSYPPIQGKGHSMNLPIYWDMFDQSKGKVVTDSQLYDYLSEVCQFPIK